MDPKSLSSLSDHLEVLSKEGGPLEILQRTVDFDYFRSWLVEGLGYGDGAKGGRPPFDPVMMFKALILQAQHNLSDARMTVGLDLAKSVFQPHGVDEDGNAVLVKKLHRKQMLPFFSKLPPCRIGVEACGTAH